MALCMALSFLHVAFMYCEEYLVGDWLVVARNCLHEKHHTTLKYLCV